MTLVHEDYYLSFLFLVFCFSYFFFFFFFTDTATTEIYTLSLHDALPIWTVTLLLWTAIADVFFHCNETWVTNKRFIRSEEHTSELQSRLHLVCRLLLEKKKKKKKTKNQTYKKTKTYNHDIDKTTIYSSQI